MKKFAEPKLEISYDISKDVLTESDPYGNDYFDDEEDDGMGA